MAWRRGSPTSGSGAHLLGRLRRQVAITADPGLEALRGYPCDQPEPEVELPGPGDFLLRLRLRHRGGELAFFSTVATFVTPLDVTVAELAIESFFPADQATAAALRRGAVTRRAGQAPAAVRRARSAAMSVIMSSWPPTVRSRPHSSRMSRTGTPNRSAARSACSRKLE
jgi:MmyB-like transcription regulator ligand binding domain